MYIYKKSTVSLSIFFSRIFLINMSPSRHNLRLTTHKKNKSNLLSPIRTKNKNRKSAMSKYKNEYMCRIKSEKRIKKKLRRKKTGF